MIETDKVKEVNYIYLIQLREWFSQNKDIYKFGRTTQIVDRKINRFEQYPKGSQIILLTKVENNLIKIENKIRKEFKKQFIAHEDGHEHFKGNSNKMIDIINHIVKENRC